MGSPPRVREKRSYSFEFLDLNGITPACAGKTSACGIKHLLIQDHPRVCGKNQEEKAKSFNEVGSPPRVREKH